MAALTAAWNTGSAASRGIACILIATLPFSIYGALTKRLAATYGPAQIIFFRGVFGFLPIAFLVYQAGGLRSLRSKHPVLQLVRGVCGLASNVCFILAYRQMPLADAFAIAYAAPIFVTVLSIPLLSERVGLHRWSAVAVGFMGVLIVTQPGSGVFGAPGDEGRIAMEAMVSALVGGPDFGGVDPLAALPDDGLVTADNVDQFTAQWDG